MTNLTLVPRPAQRPHIDANELERLAKLRPNECFLKGSGVLKLLNAIRQLERQAADLRLLQRDFASSGESAPQPVGHLHSNGNFCAERQVQSDIWPVDLFTHPFPAPAHPKLAVWFGAMPESNGNRNWTAVLYRPSEDRFLGGIAQGLTLARSEYHDRVRYEADCARFLMGELAQEPDILDYDLQRRDAPAAERLPVIPVSPCGLCEPDGEGLRCTGACESGAGSDSPAPTLAAVERRLLQVRHALQYANDTPGGGITETLWMMHGPETVFDAFDGALQELAALRSSQPDAARAAAVPATQRDRHACEHGVTYGRTCEACEACAWEVDHHQHAAGAASGASPASAAAPAASVPDGYELVLVPKLQRYEEPDWEECIRQAETATGLKVERNTLSIVIREVRRWLAVGRCAAAGAPSTEAGDRT